MFIDRPDTFWDTLEKVGDGREVWALAHNLVYDLWTLGGVRALEERQYEVVGFYAVGSTTIIYTKSSRHKVVWVDTLNLFAGALADWGKTIGLPKLEVDTQTEDTALLSRYCKRDVEILVRLWEVWERFLDTHDLGRTAKTIGSQALTAYRHRFMRHPIYIHADEKALKLSLIHI